MAEQRTEGGMHDAKRIDAPWRHVEAHGQNINNILFDMDGSIFDAGMTRLRYATMFHRIGRVVFRVSKLMGPYESVGFGGAAEV